MWRFRSKHCKNTGILGFKFCKLTFFRGMWSSYLEICLNQGSTICVSMVSASPIIMGGLNLKISQSFVGTKFFLTWYITVKGDIVLSFPDNLQPGSNIQTLDCYMFVLLLTGLIGMLTFDTWETRWTSY